MTTATRNQGRRQGHRQRGGPEVQRHLPGRRTRPTCCAAAAIYETRFANSAVAHAARRGRRLGAGRGPPSFGAQLVLGLVTNNHDPRHGACPRQYPALGQDVEGAWARIAAVSAGNERGLLMLPVAGEEVLIGFEHDDTTRPYVLGSLFNGRTRPATTCFRARTARSRSRATADLRRVQAGLHDQERRQARRTT